MPVLLSAIPYHKLPVSVGPAILNFVSSTGSWLFWCPYSTIPSLKSSHIDYLIVIEAVSKMLNVFQDSPSLSVYFKSTTARMRHSPRKNPASLSLVLQQWYGLIAIVFRKHGITALLISIFFIKGIMYLGSPFSFTLMQRFPLHRRLYAIAGLVIMTISLVASSFATHVSHLILTQGVLYAIGGSMLYTPTVIFLDEWFIARKGLAFGVMWAGTGKILSIHLKFDISSDCDRL